MTAKHWLLITVVVVLNIIVFGTLFGDPPAQRRGKPTSTWTPHPTFTPMPFPTATAILMPTLPAEPGRVSVPLPTPIVHFVAQGETLESIAEAYDVGLYVLRMANRIPDAKEIHAGQWLIIPAMEHE